MYKKILCIFLLALALFGVGCKRTPDVIKEMQSGENATFEPKFVYITNKYDLIEDESTGFYSGIKIKIDIEGYKQLTYYDAELIIDISYQALNESAKYETYNDEIILNLSPRGYGSYLSNLETPLFRNIKNVVFSYEGIGSVTKY